MDRAVMVEAVVDNLENWMEQDSQSFWDHVRDLERAYLEAKDDVELKGIYKESL